LLCCSTRSDPIREMHLQSFGIHFSTLTKSAVFVEVNLFGVPILRDSSWIVGNPYRGIISGLAVIHPES
jgi:hypothetical protein